MEHGVCGNHLVFTVPFGVISQRTMEMTAYGKPGKPKSGFPLFPHALEIPGGFPHYHGPGDCLSRKGTRSTIPLAFPFHINGDVSRRLYEVLQRYAPRVEPYSIDEMFLDLAGIPALLEHCRLIDAKTAPVQMFPSVDPIRSARLMAAMDGVNSRFGRGVVRPDVSGIDRRWTAKAEYLSPRYTTRLNEIAAVRA